MYTKLENESPKVVFCEKRQKLGLSTPQGYGNLPVKKPRFTLKVWLPWGGTHVAEHLLRVHKDLGSVPSNR